MSVSEGVVLTVVLLVLVVVLLAVLLLHVLLQKQYSESTEQAGVQTASTWKVQGDKAV